MSDIFIDMYNIIPPLQTLAVTTNISLCTCLSHTLCPTRELYVSPLSHSLSLFRKYPLRMLNDLIEFNR